MSRHDYLPESLRDPVKVMERGRQLLKEWGMHGIPRRSRIDLWIPAETAISNALQAVEALGAHPKLTEVVCALSDAQRKIADWHDGGRPGGLDTYTVTVNYPCGCKATGDESIPRYCGVHAERLAVQQSPPPSEGKQP